MAEESGVFRVGETPRLHGRVCLELAIRNSLQHERWDPTYRQGVGGRLDENFHDSSQSEGGVCGQKRAL